MPIGEFCKRSVIFVRHDHTVREVAAIMRENHVGAVVIVEGDGHRKPVGIVTDRDIAIGIVATGLDPEVLTAGDIITPELVTAGEDQGVFETLQLMRAKGVRRLPIVDAEGLLLGLVTVDDVVDLLAEELSDLSKLITNEQAREVRTRR